MLTVSINAVVKRINRRLAHNGERLLKSRGERAWLEVGDYYIMTDRNRIVATDVSPEDYAREAGVLAAHERVSA